MNIHIIATPNVNLQMTSDICNALTNDNKDNMGEIKFENINTFEWLNKEELDNINQIQIGEFDDFFCYCETYRRNCKVSENVIVVVVTDILNAKGWFSAPNGKNIFVYTDFWSKILPAQINYAIAYNIMVNVFQLLMQIDYNSFGKRENINIIHKKNIGCINDFCKDRSQIILKLRTGYICDECIQAARDRNITNGILANLYLIITRLRLKFTNLDLISSAFKVDKIFVLSSKDIRIDNITITFTPFEKAIYIFFLRHPEGVRMFGESYDHFKKELRIIYNILRPHFVEPVNRLTYGNFQYHKNKINKKLIDYLEPYRAELYKIINQHNGNDYFFYINIAEQDVEIANDFNPPIGG
jgi:hypothetical protein